MKYRYSVDIIAKILDAALCGETKSKIMMQAHLNHVQIKRYIPHILSGQLMEKRNNSRDSSFFCMQQRKKGVFFYRNMRKYN
ncbi:MAG: winged helix-turn-helix domain-containing protein [Candidatus Nitrosopolaris sp.]